MTRFAKQMFQRVGDVPKQKRGHIPRVAWNGSTLKIYCSCGHKLGGGRGCNRSGMDYGIAWAKQAYYRHVQDG